MNFFNFKIFLYFWGGGKKGKFEFFEDIFEFFEGDFNVIRD
jgi:hypothetical protein